MSRIEVPYFKDIHDFEGVPEDFKPWECGLSPSALYNCGIKCRKEMKIKTPEVKWMSIRRWVTSTLYGIDLPDGVYFSIKRNEEYSAFPEPRFVKTEYVLLMFRYGNVWSQKKPGVPIDENWLWEFKKGKLVFDRLMMKDAARPVTGYFKSVFDLLQIEKAKRDAGLQHIIGIHLKRKNGNI